MKREELWRIYVRNNPSFEGEGNITLSKAGLRKLFEQSWNFGYAKGREELDEPSSETPDFISKLFGGFKK